MLILETENDLFFTRKSMSSSPVHDTALVMSRNVLLKPLAGRFGMAQNGQYLFKVKPIRRCLRVDLILILGGATKVRQSPLAGVFGGESPV